MTEQGPTSGPPVTTVADGVPDGPSTEAVIARDPADLSGLLWYLLIVVIGLFTAYGAEQTTGGIARDLSQLASRVPEAILGFFILGIQVLHLMLFLGIPIVLLLTRRWRRWAIYTGTYLVSGVTAAVVTELVAPDVVLDLPDIGVNVGEFSGWPPPHSVATAVTALVLLSPHLNRAWRHFGWTFVAILAVLNIVTSPIVSLDIVVVIGVGGSVACAALLVFGRESLIPTPAAIAHALSRTGLGTRSIDRAYVTTGGSIPFRGTLADGRPVHCKVLTPGTYEADSLLRTYRRFRMRELGEDVPFSTLRRAASIENLLSNTARSVGVRTPEVYGVAPLGRGGAGDQMVIIFEEIAARSLAELPGEQMTDDVLEQAWSCVARMRAAGIAHRDLQLDNWLLDDDGCLWLIDFSFGEPAATDGALSVDIAELLAATYAVVGPERAVGAAVRVIGTDVLATGISHLVPAALTKPTRTAAKGQPDGLDGLIHAVAQACAVAEPQLAAIERVKPRTLLMIALLAFAVYVLLPQLADLPSMIEAIKEANPWFAAAALLASVLTYIGSAFAVQGSMPIPVKYLPSFLSAVAASFVAAFAPPSVAQIGLNVRFAQKQGLSSPVAVSATAAKQAAVTIVHVVLLILLAIAAGSSSSVTEGLPQLPAWQTVFLFTALTCVVLAGLLAVPKVRRLISSAVIPALRNSATAIRDLLTDPVKMLQLFIGALLLQTGYISALWFSTEALGGDIPIATIGLIYLTVGAAASFAPTPGGLGAVEAVLLAALTGVGMAAAPALAAVFLYRLATFWLPIPAGALAFRHLVARDML